MKTLVAAFIVIAGLSVYSAFEYRRQVDCKRDVFRMQEDFLWRERQCMMMKNNTTCSAANLRIVRSEMKKLKDRGCFHEKE